MSLFKEYKDLPDRIKTLATKYTLEVIFYLTKSKRCADVYSYLMHKHIDKSNIEIFKNKRYLEKKLKNAEAIGREYSVRTLEFYFENISSVLYHPFWQSISSIALSNRKINDLLLRLEPKVVTMLFEKDDVTSTYHRLKLPTLYRKLEGIALLNNLDALACLALLAKEMKNNSQLECFQVTLKLIRDLIFRLSFDRPFRTIVIGSYNELYQELFSKEADILTQQIEPFSFHSEFSYSIFPKHYFPSYFPANNKQAITEYVSLVDAIAQKATSFYLSKTDRKSVLTFLYWCSSENLYEVKQALESKTPAKKPIVRRIINLSNMKRTGRHWSTPSVYSDTFVVSNEKSNIQNRTCKS